MAANVRPRRSQVSKVINIENAAKNAPNHAIPVHFSQLVAISRPEIPWPPKLDGIKWH